MTFKQKNFGIDPDTEKDLIEIQDLLSKKNGPTPEAVAIRQAIKQYKQQLLKESA